VEAIERAGVGFMGPASGVLRRAGAKDEAKKLARSLGNAVIPGVDDVAARALVATAKNRAGLEAVAKKHRLAFAYEPKQSLPGNAESLLQAGYAKTAEIVTIADLQAQAEQQCAEIWAEYPKHRIRFKYIGGGGGKGQRVVA
jgi:pyruvate carboxylase